MSKKFIQVMVEGLTDRELLKEVSSMAFQGHNCGGTQIFDFNEMQVDKLLGKEAYVGGEMPQSIIDKIDSAQDSEHEAHLFFFFEPSYKEDAESFIKYLSSFNLKGKSEQKEWEDWNQEWRKYYKPIIVSELLQVYPAWEKPEGDLSSKIWINPGMGFGTGTHETTFLCLEFYGELIDTLGKEKLQVLDLGCGSGILGIAAKKFSNCDVNFCDIDKDALDNCVENLNINFKEGSLAGCTVCSRERFEKTQKYDLIFANILEPVLLMEQKEILKVSKAGTNIILSGVLEDQYQNIIDAYKNDNWKPIAKKQKNGWVSLHMKKEK